MRKLARKQGQMNTPIKLSTKPRSFDRVSLKKLFKLYSDLTPWSVCSGSSAPRVMVTIHCVTRTRASHTFGSMTSRSAGGRGCEDSWPFSNSIAEKPVDGLDAVDGGTTRARSTAKRAYVESSRKQLASMGLIFLCVLRTPCGVGNVAFICTDCR